MDFTKLKAYMDRLVREYHVPGVDCIVYKEHEQVFRYYTGMADIEAGRAMQGNELYLIFSMTKMLTCTAALQLLEKGKYLLTDPVSRYLPEFQKMRVSESVQSDGYARRPILVRDLFTMGAGLNYDLNPPGIKRALAEGKNSTRELVRAISETVLLFEPGTGYNYSLCHDVLGALIEVWSQKSFGEYMKENIFLPLGMKHTFFGIPKEASLLSNFAARYTYDENKLPKRLPLECVYILSDKYESGGAGLTSCAEDYAVFLDALANGGTGRTGAEILSPATVELMGTNHLSEQQYHMFQQLRSGYGYGLGVRTHTDKRLSGSLSPLGEFGWDGAAGAFSMVDTKNKLSLTYFQHIHGWDVRIQNEMRNALYAGLK